MKRRIVWLLASGLMVISLVLAACSTAAPIPTTTTKTIAPTGTTPATTPVTPTAEPPQKETVSSDKPQYGGTFTLAVGAGPSYFGAAVNNRAPFGDGYFLETIFGLDRTTGPAGSGKNDYSGGATSFNDVTGNLAESWSAPAVGTWVLNIRQGVRFAINPNSAGARLVNGREMKAEDVKYSIEFIRDTASSWIRIAEPNFIKNTTVNVTGPWQLTITTTAEPATGYLWILGGGGNGYIWPKEFLQQYGTNNDWKVQVGTGPFILQDFVPDSQLTFTRNTNYWQTDPVGPGKGNQLPYVSQVRYLILPDASTRLAALRTGTLDFLTGILLEDGKAILKNNPATHYYQSISLPWQVAMRTDKQNLPYKDINVRKALMMATDMQGIKDSLYQGQAEILDSPARKLYTGVYTPIDQLPEGTKELYTYNPTKAKELLKAAGFPTGFPAKLVVNAASADLGAVLKDEWAKVGVELTLDLKDATVYASMFPTRSYDEMYFSQSPGGNGALFTRYGNSYFRGPNSFNLSYANDPVGSDPIIEGYFQDVQKAVQVNYPLAEEIMKKLNLYTMSQAFLIPMPAPYAYIMWQPWINNYYGEGAAKYWLEYLWIDQKLKTSSGR